MVLSGETCTATVATPVSQVGPFQNRVYAFLDLAFVQSRRCRELGIPIFFSPHKMLQYQSLSHIHAR
mgnify:CR=1 FL=1